MHVLGWRRSGTAVLLALGLSLALAASTIAAGWSQPQPLTSSGSAEAGGLAVLGSSKAIVAYVEGGAVVTRRTADSGSTWKAPLAVSAGRDPAIAGSGLNVDLVFVRRGLVRYAHSTNGGRSFGRAIALGSISKCVGGGIYCGAATVSVARGPNGVVVVGWLDGNQDAVARVSVNNGATFGTLKVLADSTNEPYDVFVSAGTGVLYAAFVMGSWSDHSLVITRSIDAGLNWEDPNPIDTLADPDRYFGGISMTAVGTHAYVAYLASTEEAGNWVRYTRTVDVGQTWSPPVDLSSTTDYRVLDPQISLRSGVVRLVFAREETCCGFHLVYRQSTNGTTWSSGLYLPVPSGDASWWTVAGVGFAGKVIVLYSYGDAYVNVRT